MHELLLLYVFKVSNTDRGIAGNTYFMQFCEFFFQSSGDFSKNSFLKNVLALIISGKEPPKYINRYSLLGELF